MVKEITGSGGRGEEPPAGPKASSDRKTVERNRRHRMKDLCTGLFSLLPPLHFTTSKEMPSLPDQIDRATSYITQLRERVVELNARKEQAAAAAITSTTPENNDSSADRQVVEAAGSSRLRVLDLKEIMGTGLQINMVSERGWMGSNHHHSGFYVALARSITILDEEGAEVVSASFAHRGSRVFYTIHAQVKVPRIGLDTPRVRARLEELIAVV
ncbi:hypothetical protein SAY87_027091 [Trapa incisa]|uniref:BHLH domain-containing protein n=1 Tax=Trapa incisa TaxID=236973 RepID=A0AAN7GYP7_9MYRT|nr:hypothetical protein SAY87_027091 [Trapa incisa]